VDLTETTDRDMTLIDIAIYPHRAKPFTAEPHPVEMSTVRVCPGVCLVANDDLLSFVKETITRI
jgi:hypothetical protein